MSKYFMFIILLIVSFFGWWLWHHEDADFMNTFCGAYVFFCCLFCAVIVLFVPIN